MVRRLCAGGRRIRTLSPPLKKDPPRRDVRPFQHFPSERDRGFESVFLRRRVGSHQCPPAQPAQNPCALAAVCAWVGVAKWTICHLLIPLGGSPAAKAQWWLPCAAAGSPMEEALSRYQLSEDEFLSWQRTFEPCRFACHSRSAIPGVASTERPQITALNPPVFGRTTLSHRGRKPRRRGEIFRLANPPLAKCCRDRNPAVSARVSIAAIPAPKRRWLTRCPAHEARRVVTSPGSTPTTIQPGRSSMFPNHIFATTRQDGLLTDHRERCENGWHRNR